MHLQAGVATATLLMAWPCEEGRVAVTPLSPSQGSGPFTGLLGPDRAVLDTAGEEEVLDCEDGLLRRA